MGVSRKVAELFYEIRAETAGFEKDLKEVEHAAGKLGDFIAAHPVAAAGALGSALIGVGIEAAHMAEQVEKSFNVIERRIPGAEGQMHGLSASIRDMSLEQARSQEELARAAATMAGDGVSSVADLQQRLMAATRAADATGGDLTAIISGLDQVTRLFGKSGADSEAIMEKLFSVTRGKAPMQDVLDAMQRAAPAVRDLGLDFDTTAAALGALIAQGMNARQAGGELQKFAALGTAGKDAIQALAVSMGDAKESVGEYQKAINLARNSEEAMTARIKNNFSAAMIDLGNTILPKVTAELSGFLGVLNLVNGAVDKIHGDTAAATVATLGNNLAFAGDRMKDLDKATQTLASEFAAGRINFANMNIDQLRGLSIGIASADSRKSVAAKGGSLGAASAAAESDIYKEMLRTINQAIERQEILKAAAPKPVVPVGPTADQLAADDKFNKANDEKVKRWIAAQEKAVKSVRDDFNQMLIQTTSTLTDDLAAKFDILIDKAAKLGQTDLATQLEAFRDSAVKTQSTLEFIEFNQQKIASGALDTVASYDQVGESIRQAQVTLADTNLEDADREKLNAKVRDLLKEQKDLLEQIKGVANAHSSGATPDRTLENLREQARAINEAVNGALQLASAFGLVDEQMASILRNISQVATGIGPLVAALNAPAGAGGGIGAIVSAALPVVGGIAALAQSLFSGSNHAEEARKAYEASVNAWNRTLEAWVTSVRQSANEFASATADNQAKHDQLLSDLDARRQQAIRDAAPLSIAPGAQAAYLAALAKAETDYANGLRDLNGVTKEAAERAKHDFMEKQQSLDVDSNIRLLRAQGLDVEADAAARAAEHARELAAALDQGLDVAALKAAEAAEDARAAWEATAHALADALSQLDLSDQILGTGDADKIRERVAAFAKIFPELTGILDGLDLSKSDDLEQLKQRLRDLFSSFDPSNLPDGMTKDMFDGLVQAILNLMGAADDAAGSIESAADKIAAAVDALQTDWSIMGTSGSDEAQQLADTFGLGDLGDLSTQAGRDAAVKQLQDLYSKNKDNKDLAKQILQVLNIIRGVKDDAGTVDVGGSVGGGGGESAGSSTGSSSTATGGLASVSYAQGDNMASSLQLIQYDVALIRDRVMQSMLGAAAGPVTIGSIGTIYVDARGSTDPAQTQAAAVRGIDAALANVRTTLRAAAGVPRTA